MSHRTFLTFIPPSLAAMSFLVTLPILMIACRSLFIDHVRTMVATGSCGLFGRTMRVQADAAAMTELREAEPMGCFASLGTCLDHRHLAVDEAAAIRSGAGGFGETLGRVSSSWFHKALVYTSIAPLFLLFQRQIVSGLTAGAVKG